MSESGEPTAAVFPPPTKKVSIVEPIHNPDESVDERAAQIGANNEVFFFCSDRLIILIL